MSVFYSIFLPNSSFTTNFSFYHLFMLVSIATINFRVFKFWSRVWGQPNQKVEDQVLSREQMRWGLNLKVNADLTLLGWIWTSIMLLFVSLNEPLMIWSSFTNWFWNQFQSSSLPKGNCKLMMLWSSLHLDVWSLEKIFSLNSKLFY